MADPPAPPPPGQGDPPPGYGSQPPPPGYGQPPQQQYPPPKKQRGCARNLLIALGVFLAFLVVYAAIFGIVNDGDDDDVARDVATEEDDGDTNGDGETDTRNLDLYPERADRQSDDHEAELGESVRLVGYTVSVDDARMGDDELGQTNLIISVSIENRDDDAQPYNTFHWRIQTEGGQVVDPALSARDDNLGHGDVVGGGTTTGTVAFDVDPGTYYVIYKPDPYSAHRGIWRIEV